LSESDDVYVYVKDTDTVSQIDASREVCLEVNAEKMKSVFMFRHRNAGQNRNTKTVHKSFQSVTKFKYLGIAVTNRNRIHEKVIFVECLPPFSSAFSVLPSPIEEPKD